MRSITLAALALLAACAGPSQSAAGDGSASGQPSAPTTPGGAQQVTVELVPGQASSAGGDEQSATAQGGERTIVVRGTATTPTPCHRLAARVEAAGNSATLRISAAADPEAMCIQSIGAIPYTATIRGLPAGSYDLRVEHAYPGTGWESATVLETRVTVR